MLQSNVCDVVLSSLCLWTTSVSSSKSVSKSSSERTEKSELFFTFDIAPVDLSALITDFQTKMA